MGMFFWWFYGKWDVMFIIVADAMTLESDGRM